MNRKSTGGFALAIAAGAAGLASLTTSSARAELVFYEPFNYTAGQALHNQLNVSGTTNDAWTRAGTVAATNITIGSGSLTSPVGPSVGNKATLTAPATASTERLNFNPISSGSIFYSLTLNATFGTESPNTVGGAYFAGLCSFNDNGDVDSPSPPAITNTSARLAMRKDPVDATKYNLGLTNTLAQGAGNYVSSQLTQGSDVFVIVEFDVNAGTNDDVAKLWINPNAATFQPTDTPSIVIDNASPLAADMQAPQSFFLRQTGGLPQFVNVDEIRLGTSYMDVVPAPALTYYWDVNGTSSGAGGFPTGTQPDGDWDGVENNFNTNAAGGSGTFAWDPTPNDTVVFSAGSGATGNYTVFVSGTRTAAKIVVEEGHVTLGGGTLAVPAFDVAADTSAIVLSTLNGGPTNSLTKSGPGSLTLGSANTYTGGTTVNGGSLIVGQADALNAGSLSIANTAKAQLASGLPKAVTVSSVTTTGSGQLDVTDNSMVIKGMSATQVRTLLQSGYNGGAWNGATGIVSSSVTAETSVGYATQAQVGVTDFKGVSALAAGDVLVKYTYAGDANLDGKVDIGDLGLLAGAWQQLTGKVWFDGDFTYDGAVDIGDLGLLSGNWQKGTAGNPNPPLMDFAQAMAQFSAFDGVVLPEPASLSLLALVGLALGRRRRSPESPEGRGN